jgi:DNA-binding CsgD family transcriptional regulator
MNTVGDGILSLSPEAAIIVVLAQAVVLFLFSSSSLSNFLMNIGLPPIPLVPVSSTQVVVGSVLGIGLVKGSREINTKALVGIGLGWIATPLLAAILTFFALFFVQNVFDLEITQNTRTLVTESPMLYESMNGMTTINLILPGIIIAAALIIILLGGLFLRQKQLRLKAENELLQQQNQLYQAQRNLNNLEINSIQSANELLNTKLEARRKEFIDMAFNLTEQRLFLDEINQRLDEVLHEEDSLQLKTNLKSIQNVIQQKLTFSAEKAAFYGEVEKIHKDFKIKLQTSFPELSEQDRKLATLIRLNLSNKEIATLLSISPKSVEVSRYRLKKKLGLDKNANLSEFIHHL